MPRSLSVLLFESRLLLGVSSQGNLGVLLGSSERTGQRWERGGSRPSHDQLRQLAALVYPKDADLASEVCDAAGTTPEAWGLIPPAPSSLGPPAFLIPSEHVVDLIVCAAADAMQVVPDIVRAPLRAAFSRARALGLSVQTIDDALNPRNERNERKERNEKDTPRSQAGQ